MRRGPILASLLVLALSIVSAVFTLLATTSKSWSFQAIYFDQPGPDGASTEQGSGEVTPLCYWQRSPFYRCGIPQVDVNGSCVLPDCSTYAPYGYNKTSCRSAAEFGGVNFGPDNTYALGLLGRATECQEVHYAGNLQIAAAFFLVLGLLIALVLSVFTVAIGLTTSRPTQAVQVGHEGGVKDETSATQSHAERGVAKKSTYSRSHATPYVVAVLLACLYIGTLLQILAQYFGVLGLTVNATPGATDTASTQANSTVGHFVAGGWAIDRGLSTYATTAWAAAVACAAVATTVFRTPRFPKLL